ncbi:hypothetical protein PF008_g33037, partial [Phytophthora fragariae]
TNSSELFGDDVKCILEPEVTQGPYYVNGELVRSDIREDQEGVSSGYWRKTQLVFFLPVIYQREQS